MFQRRKLAEEFYVGGSSAKNISTAASYSLVRAVHSASCGTRIMVQKSFSVTFPKPFINAVATPFLVMLYISDDSTDFSDYEIRY